MINLIANFFRRRQYTKDCRKGEHLWIEWSTGDEYSRIPNTTVLRVPQCWYCGIKKFTGKEAKRHEDRRRKELKAAGYNLKVR